MYPWLVYDAPLTVSMWADCAARASRRRIGAAYALIETDRDELSVRCTAVTSVRRCPVRTMRTCTAPYCVWAAPPSMVRRTADGLVLDDVPFRELPPDPVGVPEPLGVGPAVHGPDTWAGVTTLAPLAVGAAWLSPTRQAVTRAAQLTAATPTALPGLTR